MNNNITNESIAKALCYGKNMKVKICFDALDEDLRNQWNRVQNLLVDHDANETMLREKGVSEKLIELCVKYSLNNAYNKRLYCDELNRDLLALHRAQIGKIMSENAYNPQIIEQRSIEFRDIQNKYTIPEKRRMITFDDVKPQDEPGTKWFSDGLNALHQGLPDGKYLGMLAGVNNGKSTYMYEQAVSHIKNGGKVLFLFSEEDFEDRARAIFTMYSGISQGETDLKLHKEELVDKLNKSLFLSEYKVHLNPIDAYNEITSKIMAYPEADLILLDYMQLGQKEGGNGELSNAYDLLNQMVGEEFLRDPLKNQSRAKMLFVAQATANVDFHKYQERVEMQDKARGCAIMHKHLNTWIGFTELTDKDWKILPEIREQWESKEHQKRFCNIRPENIRCFTLLKTRGYHNSKHKNWTVYEMYDPETQKTYTLGIAKNVNGNPVLMQSGYSEAGEFWYNEEPYEKPQKEEEANIAEEQKAQMGRRSM